MLSSIMEWQSSDFLFITGIVCILVGAFAQDRMRRCLRTVGAANEADMRGFRTVGAYRRAVARHGLERWPIPACYGGFAVGFGCLGGALLMLFIA